MTSQEIKAVRESLGMSQAAFARDIGVTVVQVSRWENGHSAPGKWTLPALRRLRKKAEDLEVVDG